MVEASYSLGVFNDARLEKRGPAFWARWCVGAAYVFAAWREGDVARLSAFSGSCPILR